jgi:hypothetical protein
MFNLYLTSCAYHSLLLSPLSLQSIEKISHNLSTMKFMLYGDAENEPKEAEIHKLVEELFSSDLLLELIDLKMFEFEARKDVSQIFNFLLCHHKAQSVQYIKDHREILKYLVENYNDTEIALNCGSILREIIRHEDLNEILLNDPNYFDCFFEYVQMSTFDVASDAFATFKVSPFLSLLLAMFFSACLPLCLSISLSLLLPFRLPLPLFLSIYHLSN